MSLLGPIDDSDVRMWQLRGLKALTELVQFGAKEKLPPLVWTLHDDSDVGGRVPHLAGHKGRRHPREVFEAWHDALLLDSRVQRWELGFRGDGAHRDERTDSDGRTRLMAAFKVRQRATDRFELAQVLLTAEWCEADLESAEPPDADRQTVTP